LYYNDKIPPEKRSKVGKFNKETLQIQQKSGYFSSLHNISLKILKIKKDR